MLEIDGSYLEGGGQIVRTAVALSMLFKMPIRVYNIRKNRKPPGLKMQHLKAISLLKDVGNSKISGLNLGSLELRFIPSKIEGGKYVIDIGTAGSISLFLQATILPLMFSNKIVELYVKGGTDVSWSPSIDYFRFVILPYLRRFVSDLRFEVQRRGFYPKGGGIVYLRIKPRFKRDHYSEISEFLIDLRKNVERYNLSEFSEIREFYIYSFASDSLENRKVAERQIEGAREVLESKFPNVKIIEHYEYGRTLSTGTVITIVATRKNGIIFGSDNLGKIGKASEEVGREAAEKILLIERNQGVIDEHLSDNLVPYLALVGGSMKVPVFTKHLLTNIWVCERFFGEIFDVDEKNKTIRSKF